MPKWLSWWWAVPKKNTRPLAVAPRPLRPSDGIEWPRTIDLVHYRVPTSPNQKFIELKRKNEQLRRRFVELDKRVAELEKHNDISRADKS